MKKNKNNNEISLGEILRESDKGGVAAGLMKFFIDPQELDFKSNNEIDGWFEPKNKDSKIEKYNIIKVNVKKIYEAVLRGEDYRAGKLLDKNCNLEFMYKIVYKDNPKEVNSGMMKQLIKLIKENDNDLIYMEGWILNNENETYSETKKIRISEVG